jgi:hypothetical protein
VLLYSFELPTTDDRRPTTDDRRPTTDETMNDANS